MIADIDKSMSSIRETHLSVVIPVYGAPELISELCTRLHKSLREITQDYEIILVFDCSPDNSWERIYNGQKKPRSVSNSAGL